MPPSGTLHTHIHTYSASPVAVSFLGSHSTRGARPTLVPTTSTPGPCGDSTRLGSAVRASREWQSLSRSFEVRTRVTCVRSGWALRSRPGPQLTTTCSSSPGLGRRRGYARVGWGSGRRVKKGVSGVAADWDLLFFFTLGICLVRPPPERRRPRQMCVETPDVCLLTPRFLLFVVSSKGEGRKQCRNIWRGERSTRYIDLDADLLSYS